MLSLKRRITFKSPVLGYQLCRYLGVAQQADFYKELGLKSNASSKDIKAAFISLSKKCHPDVNTKDPNSHDRFIAINEAYRTLINAESRRAYDSKRHSFTNHTNNLHQYYSSHPSVHRPYMSSEAYRREFERATRERVFYPPRDDNSGREWSRKDFRSPRDSRLFRLYSVFIVLCLLGYFSIREHQKDAKKFYVAKDLDYEQYPSLVAITKHERMRLRKHKED